MKLTEKEKNAIVNEALFNLGAYCNGNMRDLFEYSSDMDDVAIALLEEIWEPEFEWRKDSSIPSLTKDAYEASVDMMAQILNFIESHAEVRDWLLQILEDNELESLYEEAYEILNHEYFETKEAQKKALEPVEKRIKQLTADAEAMKEAWDCFKKIKYGNKSFDMFF